MLSHGGFHVLEIIRGEFDERANFEIRHRLDDESMVAGLVEK